MGTSISETIGWIVIGLATLFAIDLIFGNLRKKDGTFGFAVAELLLPSILFPIGLALIPLESRLVPWWAGFAASPVIVALASIVFWIAQRIGIVKRT